MKHCMNCMKDVPDGESACSFCGWDGTENDKDCLTVGSILRNRYIVGTMRTHKPADICYIAWDALFSRIVYLMEYYPASIARRESGGRLETDEKDRRLMRAGVKRFLEISDCLIAMDETHGLLNVWAGFEENNTAYMILEYPGDKTLRDVLTESGPWDIEKTEKLVRNIVRPLQAAYERKMIHGQMNVDCCYLTADGNFKLGFFNDAFYLTEENPYVKTEEDRQYIDCFELAHIAGSALTGIDTWEGQDVEVSMNAIKGKMPECAFKVMDEVMSESAERGISVPRIFLDRFTGDITICNET